MRLFVLPLFVFAGCTAISDKDFAARIDEDGDSYVSTQFAGSDCDDADPTIHPDATDAPYDGIDANCDGASDNDADGDGADDVTHGGGDCDDTNADIHPGVAEVCDGRDTDCDGATPADESDIDGDGYLACVDDCDDDNPAIHPGGVEVCDPDDADEDCDGTVDDADSDATGQATWYRDGDEDGYGDPAVTQAACDTPGGFVDNDEDCDDTDAALTPGSRWYLDSDEDSYGDTTVAAQGCYAPEGYIAADGDCDDQDPTLNPGADEVCDAVDNDCDGAVDDDDADVIGRSTWYTDNDGDAFGDSATAVASCTQPARSVFVAGDCDDTVGTIYPGAPETCDGADDNCDRTLPVDEQDLDGDSVLVCEGDCDDGVSTTYPGANETWYDGVDSNCDGASDNDQDADGFDDDAHGGTDCDDRDANVFAGAPDVWYDGVDSDCDGAPDFDQDHDGHDDAGHGGDDCNDLDPDVHPGATETWYDGVDEDCRGDDDNDQDADGYAAVPTGGADCDDLVDATHPGAAEVWYDGVDSDCSGGSDFDADGDGFDAVASGGDDCDDTAVNAYPGAGEHFGNGIDEDCDGFPDSMGLADADAKIVGAHSGDQVGRNIARIGDVDGDGYEDILLGSASSDARGFDSGAAYLMRGPLRGASTAASAAAIIGGSSSYRYYADFIGGPGDVNGDGVPDLCIGADYVNSSAGEVQLVSGAIRGNVTESAAFETLMGEHYNDNVGRCAGAGDLDGDGNADILVSGIYSDDGGESSGAAYLVGAGTGAVNLSTARAKFVGEGTYAYAGGGLNGAGDVNGDGVDDLWIGSSGNTSGGTAAGAAYLIYGPATGTMDLSAADAKITGRLGANIAYVEPAADANGDGLPDLLLASPNDSTVATNAGVVYLMESPFVSTSVTSAAASIYGTAAGEYAGINFVSLDANDDGIGDILAGAYNTRGATTNAGAASLFLGPFAGTGSFADAAALMVGENTNDSAGYELAAADVDGDGVRDILLGSVTNSGGGPEAGAVYVLNAALHF